MPSDVAALLSGGVSMGILAGVVSGLFYLVLTGLRWAGEVRHFSGEWLNKQLQRHLGTPSVEDNRRHRNDDGSAMDSESVQVREFIERLVETLISGGLDQVNVNRLYSHPEYDRMFECHHGSLCNALTRLAFSLQMAIANKPLDEKDSPSAAHADLKQLIHKVVREAMTLPALSQFSQNDTPNRKAIQEDVNTKTYEEILATAILNKVIQRFQQFNVNSPNGTLDGNSNLLPVVEAKQRPKFVSRVEIGMASSSSVDDDASAVDDASWSGSSHTEPLSLTIEECVEEEMTTYNSSEEYEDNGDETTGAELDFYLSGLNFIKKHRVPFPELGMDIVDSLESEDDGDGEECSPLPTDLLSPVDSWEDNWLFQRRRLKTLGSREPVPMLVPNPSEDFRALIGDRDAEEISDLSDCSDSVIEDILADDDEDEEGDNVPAPKPELTKKASLEISLEVPRLTESLTEVPKGPKVENLQSEDVVDESTSLTNHEPDFVEARNEEFTNGIDSLSEFGQQDSEYTEDYASVTRRQMNSLKRHQGLDTKPVPKPRKLGGSSNNSEDGSSKNESTFESSSDFSLESIDSVNELATPPRPGTIAEREHKKWESAVPLPNNPYSQENIMKRLNRSSLLDIRTSCNALPEIDTGSESKMEKDTIPCLEKDENIKRYRRDYYINTVKQSSDVKSQTSPAVEIVMMSSPVQPKSEVTKQGERMNVPLGKPSSKLEELPVRVGSQVCQWQNEINQTEEIWLKKMNNCKNESNINISDTDTHLEDKTIVPNGIHSKITSGKQSSSEKQNNLTLFKKENSRHDTKQEKTINTFRPNKDKNTNYLNAREIVIIPMPETHIDTPTRMANSDVIVQKREINVKISRNENDSSGQLGEGSNSDCEQIIMPSVKDLAKHFTQNNQSTLTKRTHPVERPNGRLPSVKPGTKKVVPPTVNGSTQPMREIHSLTARSISREFREELKRNLPSQRDRNVNGSDSSLARSDSSLDQGLLTLPRSDVETSTTPSCTSDDSSGPSPTPGSLRNNIAFWEQMQRNK